MEYNLVVIEFQVYMKSIKAFSQCRLNLWIQSTILIEPISLAPKSKPKLYCRRLAFMPNKTYAFHIYLFN